MNEPTLNPRQNAVNRRRFLKSSSLAAGAVAALPIERFAHAQQDNTLKLALVGCGGRGSGATIQAMNTGKDVKLVAMADAFEDKLANKLSAIRKVHPNQVDVPPSRQFVGKDAYKKAIAEADVCVLATPPGFRPIHFEEAIRQGKHVFFEKPVAVDAPGIRRVLAAAKEAKKKNLKVAVGLQRRHQPSYIEAIQRIHDGAIGDVVSMRSYWNGNPVGHKGTRQGLRDQWQREPTEMEYQMRNWYQFVWLCGDHIVEQHIHNLDVGNWLAGDYPVEAQGQGGRQVRTDLDHGEIYDHHMVEYTYASGAKMISQCRHIPRTWSNVSEHVHGSEGTANISAGRIESNGGWKWRFRDDAGHPFQVEHDVLFDAIRSGKKHNEAEYGAKSTLTSILGRMATYSGQSVTWEEALESNLALVPSEYSWEGTPPTLPDSEGRYPIPMPGSTVAF